MNLNQPFRHRRIPAGNPLANVLVVIVGILVISLSLALGFVVFVAVASFVLIMAAIMSVRGWWLARRGVAPTGTSERGTGGRKPPQQVIEGEYTEVQPRDDRHENR